MAARSASIAAAACLLLCPAAIGRQQTPPAPWELRQVLLARRYAAIARGDIAQTALINADLGREATRRARGALDAWMRLRSRETGLFPQSTTRNEWNYNNAAADLFCFLWIAASRTAAPALADLYATLDAEAVLAPAGELCGPVRWDNASPLATTEIDRIFGTSEYAKDGLLSVVEATGDIRAMDRLQELARIIIKHSRHNGPRGPIPGSRSEINGNMLQVFSRLGCEPDGDDFAEAAARIADAVVEAVLPANHGLPAENFDYTSARPITASTRLRDHGNEIIPGLAEAYALAVTRGDDPAWRARADRWRPALLAMFERIMSLSIDANGLMIGAIDPATGSHLDPAPNDNWGYILCGALLMVEAMQRDGNAEQERAAALLARIDATAAAVARTTGLEWEPGSHDGYADTIESALYIAAHRPSLASDLLPWAHSQIGIMFSMQKHDGFIGRTYLDGNFIRTALMYADMCAGGWSVSPPDAGISIGFATGTGGAACIVITADHAYRGTLAPPPPWSEHTPRLAWDWPRLNSWPRWSRIEDLSAIDAAIGLAPTPTVRAIREGLPLELEAGERITIHARFTPAAP